MIVRPRHDQQAAKQLFSPEKSVITAIRMRQKDKCKGNRRITRNVYVFNSSVFSFPCGPGRQHALENVAAPGTDTLHRCRRVSDVGIGTYALSPENHDHSGHPVYFGGSRRLLDALPGRSPRVLCSGRHRRLGRRHSIAKTVHLAVVEVLPMRATLPIHCLSLFQGRDPIVVVAPYFVGNLNR